jgi:hypothetical protein
VDTTEVQQAATEAQPGELKQEPMDKRDPVEKAMAANLDFEIPGLAVVATATDEPRFEHPVEQLQTMYRFSVEENIDLPPIFSRFDGLPILLKIAVCIIIITIIISFLLFAQCVANNHCTLSDLN